MRTDKQNISGRVSYEKPTSSLFNDFLRRLIKEKPLGTFGGIIVLIFVVIGVFANFIAPYSPIEMIVSDRMQSPRIGHPMGTDNLGRDTFSRVVYATRISMTVGLAGSILCTFLATLIGLLGFFGGRVDMIIQRFIDGLMCFPELIIYLSVMSILGPGLIQVIWVLGAIRGIHQSRVIRGAVLSIKENIYINASRAIGCSPWWILVKHIIPNIGAPIAVVFTVSMGYLILGEATLSFLGLGIPPPMPSWGGMLSSEGRRYMLINPWMALFPGLALSLVVYGLNMFGDAVRDLLDPRLRGGIGRYSQASIKDLKKQQKGQSWNVE